MNIRMILCSGVVMSSAIVGSGSDARAQSGDILTYGCGRSPGITISVNPMAGKGTFADATAQGAFARAPLVPDQKGAWVNGKLGISFFPESLPPTVSAGDAQFTCRQKAAAAPAPAPKVQPPVAGAIASYKCATILVDIDIAKGKGRFRDQSAPQMVGGLSRQRDGTWREASDGVIFSPNASPPSFEAGDAEFKCRKTAPARMP